MPAFRAIPALRRISEANRFASGSHRRSPAMSTLVCTRICDKVSAGQSFAQVMGDVKSDVTPSDEFAANYLISYAVSQYCPEQIWQLRNSAAGYQAPPGTESPVSGLQGDVAGK